jgi:putative MATE family efflux protein
MIAKNALITGPILSTLLKLAVPNVLAMSVSVWVGIAETWYVGQLGTVPLAAMALVFPFAMLTQMMSSGAMGGGVSSAISRALGANDIACAQTLAFHALVIGLVVGTIYAVIFIYCGPIFYALLGGKNEVLKEATAFSNVLFIGAIGTWVMNALASVVRGSGNMKIPSLVILVSSIAQILIGGGLSLPAGMGMGMGMPGIAIGNIVAMSAGAAYLFWYLVSGRGRLKMAISGVKLQRALFFDILKVGALACLSPLQSVLAVVVITGLISRLGVVALAGYSIGQRLEFLLIPLAFGIGVASVPMVGMAIGAGDVVRARKVAWTAGLVSAVNLSVVGLLVTVFPQMWANLFTQDAAVLQSAYQYLRWVGPAFGFFGLGLTLYFASQGSGKVMGPVLASTMRLVVIALIGAWLNSWSTEPWPYYALVAAGMVIYGLTTSLSIWLTPWGANRQGSTG